ncbi:MAG: diguanylate cyclase [Sphaerochaetaceae bacterium]|nr:diguanylate cyclase [Sphaerochaetaceae bacterium]
MKTMFRASSLVLILVSCLVVGVFYVLTTRAIEDIYLTDTRQAIRQIKQDFIRDTVNNLVTRIETRRKAELSRYDRAADEFQQLLVNISPLLPEQEFASVFTIHFSQRVAIGVWDAYLWNTETGELLFDPNHEFTSASDAETRLPSRLSDYAVYKHVNFYGLRGFFGVRQSVIDDIVKQAVAKEIHASKFAEDSYIWVNEVVNYDGGDNYAIRRIHPNLVNTEGIFLSTSMTDIVGNFPYLTELEGVKMYGELYFTYNFKKKNSDVISEKLSYAKLYKPYDWIIAMGIHLDDMEALSVRTNEKSQSVTARILPWFVVILVLVVASGYGILILMQRWKVKRSQRALEEAANYDALTRVFNRRSGMNDLAASYMGFHKKRHPSPAIMIFDIDDFKRINDTHGHTIGDKALQVIARTVSEEIRSTDRIYRWGGDEFVLVCKGIALEHLDAFCTKLLARIRTLHADCQDCNLDPITISLGATFFHEEDLSHLEAMERADQALYKAKRSGKDRFEVQL